MFPFKFDKIASIQDRNLIAYSSLGLLVILHLFNRGSVFYLVERVLMNTFLAKR